MSEIKIDLVVTGAEEVKRQVAGVGSAGKQIGGDVKQGAGAAQQGLQQIAPAAAGAANAISNASRHARTDLKSVAAQADGTRDSLKTMVGAVGAGIALGGINMFTSRLISTGQEAANAQKKLEAMLNVRGQSGSLQMLRDAANDISKKTGFDDDNIADAQAHLLSFGMTAQQVKDILPGAMSQSITMGQDLNSVIDSVGRAMASLNAGAMRRSGVVIDQATIDKVKELKDAGDFAGGQKVLFDALKKSFAEYAVKLGEGMDQSTVKIGYFNKVFGDTQETLGQGAANVRAAWMSALTPMLEGLNKNHEGLVSVAGGFIEVGTQAANVLVPLVQAGMQFRNFKALQIIATQAAAIRQPKRLPL
jgi:hypothetical protein